MGADDGVRSRLDAEGSRSDTRAHIFNLGRLLTGFGEVLLLGVKRLVLGRPIWFGPDVIWITAADYLQTDDASITVLDDRGGSFKGPAAFLADFRGKLQADAYSYDGLYNTGRVVEIGC